MTETSAATVICRINRCAAAGDQFGVLGLDPDVASQRDVEKKYRELSKFVHPDHAGGSAAAEAAFKNLASAKDSLVKGDVDFRSAAREAGERRRARPADYGPLGDPTTGIFSFEAFNAMIATRATRKRDPAAAAASGTVPTRGPSGSSPSGHWSSVPQYMGTERCATQETTTFATRRVPTPDPAPVDVGDMMRKMYAGCRKAPGPRMTSEPAKRRIPPAHQSAPQRKRGRAIPVVSVV
jgi:hypothetical protein